MIRAFSPGHITCFFQPISSFDPLSAGSRGAGIRLSLGSTVNLKPSSSNETEVEMDGKIIKGEIVRNVVKALDPKENYKICIKHDLPVGQGFGTTAADAVATALCMCHITNKSKTEGYRAAHVADLLEGGGRGDVAGIMSRYQQPVRTVAGIPPFGKVEDSHVNVGHLTLITLGLPLITGAVLSDKDKVTKIRDAGAKAMNDYLANMSLKSLFKISNQFSEDSGLRTNDIDNSISKIEEKGYMAAMCMLGNSIFTNASLETVKKVLGNVSAVACTATTDEARIIRTE